MMLATADSALAIGFHCCPSSCRPSGGYPSASEAAVAPQHVARDRRRTYWQGSNSRLFGRTFLNLDSSRYSLFRTALPSRIDLLPVRACAVPEHTDGPPPDQPKSNYHLFEEIEEALPLEDGEVARLTDAEAARTIVEVNNYAALIFEGLVDNGVHENIILPDLPYLTDEHGDIYFEVNKDEGLLGTLIADEKTAQIMIGLDSTDMLTDMMVSSASDFDFSVEEIISEESDSDDNYEEDNVAIFEDEDDVSSEILSDWTNYETMNTSHPMYFAKRIADPFSSQAVANTNMDLMDQPPATIVIQGCLRPVFVEENALGSRHPSNGAIFDRNPDKDQNLQTGAAFFKLEISNIQLVTAYGTESVIKVEDFQKARPDIIAHSAANIISRLRAGGEKITQALKLLCWRQKGIHIEESTVIGVDSLGFDLRICSGTQVQTLRFAFNTQATSEFGAERQLHDLLFPMFHQGELKRQQARKKE